MHAAFPDAAELRRIGVTRSYATDAENRRRVAAFTTEWRRLQQQGAEDLAQARRRSANRHVMLTVGLVGAVFAVAFFVNGMTGRDGRALQPGYAAPAPIAAPVPEAPRPHDPTVRRT